jgi:hypothetical protein
VFGARLGIGSILLEARCHERVIEAAKSIDGSPAGRVLLQPGGINMRERIFGIVPTMTTPFSAPRIRESLKNAELIS